LHLIDVVSRALFYVGVVAEQPQWIVGPGASYEEACEEALTNEEENLVSSSMVKNKIMICQYMVFVC